MKTIWILLFMNLYDGAGLSAEFHSRDACYAAARALVADIPDNRDDPAAVSRWFKARVAFACVEK